TGEGQFVDVSAVEVLSSMIGDLLLEQNSAGRDLGPDGNRHRDMAPHGCYPYAGADWIAIAVADDAEWHRLCDVLEAGKLADDPRYALSQDRIANADGLDVVLSGLTTAHNAAGLAQRLRRAGVAANKSAKSIDVIGDELLWDRGFYRFVSDHREGQRPVVGPPWRMSRASARIERGAPDLGEDNEYVFDEVLGKVTP